ncbi:hypothetical protein [Streptomyces cyaneogriseus]|uniref:hypothetical protein n=1 Tax=Streptomyces cyaneogriseus TaxID=68192 RepID=UPI00069BAB81|nr:hypothetical protein [Streptomyces cyaneogriseus]
MREDVDEDLAVTSYATAQRPGDRVFQCDATAVCTMPDGTRAYALLDGVGDTPAVRSWTRTAARRLARAAAGSADAMAGLRAEYDHYAADPARTAGHDLPCAAAVVAVHVPGGLFSLAWSGDARAARRAGRWRWRPPWYWPPSPCSPSASAGRCPERAPARGAGQRPHPTRSVDSARSSRRRS